MHGQDRTEVWICKIPRQSRRVTYPDQAIETPITQAAEPADPLQLKFEAKKKKKRTPVAKILREQSYKHVPLNIHDSLSSSHMHEWVRIKVWILKGAKLHSKCILHTIFTVFWKKSGSWNPSHPYKWLLNIFVTQNSIFLTQNTTSSIQHFK